MHQIDLKVANAVFLLSSILILNVNFETISDKLSATISQLLSKTGSLRMSTICWFDFFVLAAISLRVESLDFLYETFELSILALNLRHSSNLLAKDNYIFLLGFICWMTDSAAVIFCHIDKFTNSWNDFRNYTLLNSNTAAHR